MRTVLADPSLPVARTRSDRFRCGGRESKILAGAALLFLSCASCALDITTIDGKTYRGCRITKVEDNILVFQHDEGSARLSYTKLPRAIRDKYFDPAKILAHERQIEEAAQAAARKAAEERRMKELALLKLQEEQKQAENDQRRRANEEKLKQELEAQKIKEIAALEARALAEKKAEEEAKALTQRKAQEEARALAENMERAARAERLAMDKWMSTEILLGIVVSVIIVVLFARLGLIVPRLSDQGRMSAKEWVCGVIALANGGSLGIFFCFPLAAFCAGIITWLYFSPESVHDGAVTPGGSMKVSVQTTIAAFGGYHKCYVETRPRFFPSGSAAPWDFKCADPHEGWGIYIVKSVPIYNGRPSGGISASNLVLSGVVTVPFEAMPGKIYGNLSGEITVPSPRGQAFTNEDEKVFAPLEVRVISPKDVRFYWRVWVYSLFAGIVIAVLGCMRAVVLSVRR